MGNAEQSEGSTAQEVAVGVLPLFGFSGSGHERAAARLTLIAHWENTIYRVDSDDATFVLRLHPAASRTVDMVSSELGWLEFLCERGLRVPRPHLTLDGRRAVCVGVGDPSSTRVCSVLSWMPGEALPASRQTMERAGALLARLHGSGVRTFTSFNRPKLDFGWLVGERGGLGYGPAPLQELPTRYSVAREMAIPLVAEAFAIVADAGAPLLPIHGDFHLNNLVFDNEGAAPIDFDDCGMGLPHYDIATVLHLYRESEEWPDLRDALLRGYGSFAPLPPHLLETLDRFMLARRLCMLMWMAAKARADDRMRAQVPKMLDNLERLLALTGVNRMKGSS
ncbi:phosphotransferase [Aquabacterium sp. A7-Y]|uniref:phosphotransferase enzyme family protein n=1 Tax=Aquabacterium sp. A7-Y TaxID=1349605 RepID=UPI00223C95AF|nr:phosphotransferase [Aquabacterium sp. A7-Y]MCW7536789.1 phosphotransferase [Aquabacterium sp. A7-Y]